MDIIKLYCDFVIKPVEEHTKELRTLVANKSIFEKIFKIDYKDKALDEMELLLHNCYIKLSEIVKEEIVKEEIAFNKYVQDALKENK